MRKEMVVAEEEIEVVDDSDNVIGHKPRNTVDAENLRYRVSALWIKNSKGESLLAKRAYTKTHDPGRWGPAVAGTVPIGESYSDTIKREAKEELGLDNIEFNEGPKRKIDGTPRHFDQWFMCIVDKPSRAFIIQQKEVAEVKWFSKEEMKKQLETNPEEFLKRMKEYCKIFG